MDAAAVAAAGAQPAAVVVAGSSSSSGSAAPAASTTSGAAATNGSNSSSSSAGGGGGDPPSPPAASAPAAAFTTSVKQEVTSPSGSEPSSPLEASSPGVSVGAVARPAPTASSGREQQYAAADSNSSTPAKSFVPCKVCGDKASGYHYGVTSCEGCKGFFRRSIQKQIEYRCLRDGKCLVIRLNRNRCQYCRFKKCLAVGMSRDSVRYGRVPKRSRERSGEEAVATRVGTSDAEQSDAESRQLAVYDVILTVSQAYHANCGYTEEQTRALVRKPLATQPHLATAAAEVSVGGGTSTETSEVASSTAESLEQHRVWLWQQFAQHVTPSVQRVVEFAKRVPGFCDLSQDDQLILIKVGFFEIWLTHVSRLTSDSSLTFSDGTYITKQQMEVMYDVDFVTSVFHFASTFNALALNDTELGLFSAVVLLTADRTGITDIKAVEHHQDRLIDALKVQIGRNHASDPQLFASLLVKLPELRNLGVKHSTHLEWFRLNWTKLRLPPLFAEIFDIPKCEEDLQ